MALPLNPNWSLEPKHILFFIEQIVWLCNAGIAELRQVTKTDKIPIRQ